MVKHVVIWKLKESALGKSKKENLDTMKKMLEDMRPKIKEIKEMEIGLNIEGLYEGNWDIMLSTLFESAEALEIYQNHPDHEVVKEFVKEVRSDRACVDFKL